MASACRGGRSRRRARSTRRSIATSTTMACAIRPSRWKRARWSRPGTRQAEQPTNASGAVTVGGLTAYQPIAVGIDQTSLVRPNAGARRRRSRWWCRVPAFRRRWRSGWSAAAISKARSSRAAGSGSRASTSSWSTRPARSSATARTDFDGFFLFERVAYGNYTVRVAKDSAAAAKIVADLGVRLQGQRRKGGRSPRLDHASPAAAPSPQRVTRPSDRSRSASGLPAELRPSPYDWCGREDSNFHGLSATATSTLRVYQFRHDRTS